MNAASNFTASRTTDSTTRTTVTTIGISQPTSVTVRIGETVRRLMNAVMNSLATPHI